ncbi:hypothetical protein [Mucilaginibacter flavus]|uniref:hypothetical protein n=1 Tax=Mucilaginibacter flavus TaxID=931504 RepID=UPI0025B58893|nr:hypothetical protein [Mucilaginibacter flavus]MDN3581549.1 hypothetical protein [Mucilaginibacter flavus]
MRAAGNPAAFLKAAAMQNDIKEQLKQKGYEMLNYTQEADGSLAVNANKLHPVTLADDKQYYIPIPLSLQVHVDAHDKITALNSQEDEKSLESDADHFVRNLADNQEIGGDGLSSVPNATHHVDINEDGLPVIRKKRSRMF